jgi:hypothetical protein
MSKSEWPEEQSDEDLEAAFRKVVEDAIAWATTEGKRDQVMNALHDVLVGLGPHDGEDPGL